MKLAAVVALFVTISVARGAEILQVDYRKLVSRADLDYTTPATRSEEGQPIGNGRMGSLVWTTPSALHFQINRVDVFGQDSDTTSFPKQDSDYASGCGYVDINLCDAGDDVFAGEKFNQHLSIYDAMMTARGTGVTARVVASPLRDIMAIEIDDQREQPAAINIDLRMLRYAIQGIGGKNFPLAADHTVEVHTAEHTAASHLDIRTNLILLTQTFTEHDHYSASAVAIGVWGRIPKARYLNESTVQLAAAGGKGKFTIMIASAASLKRSDNVGEMALTTLTSAPANGFPGVAEEATKWWHDYWSRAFVSMHSGDGQADFVEANYTYFLYIMGCVSHGGQYPPRFGGLLFYTNGDMRRWGSQYWWANQQAYYSNLMPANRMELMEPLLAMYSNMLDACRTAAKQQWGAEGIWIPEITFFNGPERLPDDIATELQDLVLARKPYEQRSQKFQWWAETKNRHNARWNFQGDGHFEHGHFVVPDKGAGIFGHCTHILADASRIGNLYYQRYLFTRDKDFLRDRAYPILKGAAEFYRTFPNVKKGGDGKYHIHHVNNNEGGWDTSDTPMEIAGMRTAFSLAVRTSEILGVDEDLRPKWQEMLDHLATAKESGRGRRPATSQSSQSSTRPAGGNRPFGAFVYGGPGAIPANEPEAELKRRFLGFNALGSFIDPAGIGGAQIFRNRLRLREGPGAIDCEHLGGLVAGIHSTLLNNEVDDRGESTIEIFAPAWPRSWDCAFELLAHGGFVVASSLQNGTIDFVRIKSPLGGKCRMKNPWPAKTVMVRSNETLSGDVLEFDTTKNETITLMP